MAIATAPPPSKLKELYPKADFIMLARISQLRIVESEPEASLHPSAIWNYWKKYVIWDPRSYYGLLEFTTLLVCLLASQQVTQTVSYSFLISNKPAGIQRLCTGILLLFSISALHWYSNHRSSRHFLTRSSSHFAILVFLGITTFVAQLTFNLIYGNPPCVHRFFNEVDCQTIYVPNLLLWISIPILFFAAYLIYTAAHNPRKDPILAELPSPVDTDYEQSRLPWTNVNVADGIEDDSAEPEGQVRL